MLRLAMWKIEPTTREWCARMQLWRSKRFFPLQTSNKAAASAKARDIYVCLAANGWEAPLAKQRKPKAIAQEGDSEQPIRVGQFLDAIFRTATTQRTVEGYAMAFSQNR
jgi:hypothetical protein